MNVTRTISFTEFRRNASEILDLVERGETVRILRHGKPVARIEPEGRGAQPPAWKRRGLRLVTIGKTLSRAIVEERQTSP